jgi:tetratricopeptide (TPR) repeat protein
MRKVYLLGIAQLVLSLTVLLWATHTSAAVEPVSNPTHDDSHDRAATWFERSQSRCNSGEVLARLRRDPAPGGLSGSAYAAACLALAGEVDQARETLTALPEEQRWRAAGVVFEVVYPTADSEMDAAAGPAMELVLEFWPNHWMALYHAGATRFERGDREGAAQFLERFLAEYPSYDGWRADAIRMLGKETD